jgi:cytochrome c biogenesis protein CcdA
MNYAPLAFTLGFFEVLVFLYLLFLTIYIVTPDNQNDNDKITTTNYLLQVFCGLLLMVALSLGVGKAISMGDNTKVEQENTK